MAPNFCAHCGAKVIPEQKFCQDCGVLLATTSTDTVTNGSVPLSATPSSTTQSRTQINARVLGIIGGVMGLLIGALSFAALLDNFRLYYAGYYSEDVGPLLLVAFLVVLAILAFSILGILAAAQKLDSRPKINAGILFLAGIVLLVCFLYVTIPGTTNTTFFSIQLVIILIELAVSVLFFLSGYLLLRKPAG